MASSTPTKGMLALQALSACMAAKEGEPWGRKLTPTALANSAPATAICRSATHLFTCGKDVLTVYDISADPARPRKVSDLCGINFGRQMLFHRQKLFVTARYYGLYVIDVKDPEQPALLKNYTTLELATGIAVDGDILYVTLRTYGVELLDISDPAQPRHLSLFRSRESQSCCAFGEQKLAVGDWYHGSVALVDVSDPVSPRLISEALMEGYGDGVQVVGRYCYASTGHHRLRPGAAEESAPPGEDDKGWGHGLEIFDISELEKPVRVSRLQFPRWTPLKNDYWTPYVIDNTVFAADTHNGLFIVDVSDKRTPRGIAQVVMPQCGDLPACVSALAFADQLVYIAANEHGLFTLRVQEARYSPPPATERKISVTASVAIPANFLAAGIGKAYRLALSGDLAFVAADDDGIALIEFTAGGARVLKRYAVTGCYDVAVHGDLLYAAERFHQCVIYRIGAEGALTPLSRIATEYPRIVKCLHVVANGRLLMMTGGHIYLDVYDVSNPLQPRKVHTTTMPLFYSDSLPTRELKGMMLIDRYWLGARWLNVGKDIPELGKDHQLFLYQLGGSEALQRHFIAVANQGTEYALFDPETQTVSMGCSDGRPVRGIPTFDGDHTVVFADRKTGTISAFDVTDEARATFIPERSFSAPCFNPERVVFRQGKMLIPLREQGLIIER